MHIDLKNINDRLICRLLALFFTFGFTDTPSLRPYFCYYAFTRLLLILSSRYFDTSAFGFVASPPLHLLIDVC